jgi:hypothetical protein
MKNLVSNLKSIGNIAKFSLLGLWLIAVITLSALSFKQATSFMHHGTTIVRETLPEVATTDTLMIQINDEGYHTDNIEFNVADMRLAYDNDGKAYLYSEDVRFDIQQSKDDQAHLKISKEALGSHYNDAKNRSSNIDYQYRMDGNTLWLDGFLSTDKKNLARDQEVRIKVEVPTGTLLTVHEDADSHMGWGTQNDHDFSKYDMGGHLWKMDASGELICQDCPETVTKEEDSRHSNSIKMDADGIDIDLKGDKDSLRLKIDSDGIELKASDN